MVKPSRVELAEKTLVLYLVMLVQLILLIYPHVCKRVYVCMCVCIIFCSKQIHPVESAINPVSMFPRRTV